jgi:hypothetical protein
VDEIAASGDGTLPPIASLNEILLETHCQLGYNLLQKWNVPEIYCQIARDHHSDHLSPEDLPLTIVRLANNGSRKLGLGMDPKSELNLEATMEANLLGIGEVLLSELQSMLEEHIAIAA